MLFGMFLTLLPPSLHVTLRLTLEEHNTKLLFLIHSGGKVEKEETAAAAKARTGCLLVAWFQQLLSVLPPDDLPSGKPGVRVEAAVQQRTASPEQPQVLGALQYHGLI